MAGVKGRSGGARQNSGGARPGAGRRPKALVIKIAQLREREMELAAKRAGRGCYVYVVHEVGVIGVCKIGIAVDVAKRLATLQIGTWRPLMVEAALRLPSQEAAEAVEAAVHQAFAPLHCRGEWFSVGADRAVAEVKATRDRLVAAFGEADLAMAQAGQGA